MKRICSKPLDIIFALTDPAALESELSKHCVKKQRDYHQSLTEAETVFESIERMGGQIAGDGFLSLFHEIYSPNFFSKICDALTEVGGTNLRDLLREAWSIYTKDKHPITHDELQGISICLFNTEEKMDRFDQIGEEVMKEIAEQYDTGKVWSVEYARRHRDEFRAIEGLTIAPAPANPEPPPSRFSTPVPQTSTPPPLPYLAGRTFSNPIFRQVKHPKDIFAMESKHQFVFALALHGTLKWHELKLPLTPSERSFQLLTSLVGKCYDAPVEKWLGDWNDQDLDTVKAALREGGAARVVELIEQARPLLDKSSVSSEELARISTELHGADVAAELHKAQVSYARAHQADFLPV